MADGDGWGTCTLCGRGTPTRTPQGLCPGCHTKVTTPEPVKKRRRQEQKYAKDVLHGPRRR